jgi:hypothetical protein
LRRILLMLRSRHKPEVRLSQLYLSYESAKLVHISLESCTDVPGDGFHCFHRNSKAKSITRHTPGTTIASSCVPATCVEPGRQQPQSLTKKCSACTYRRRLLELTLAAYLEHPRILQDSFLCSSVSQSGSFSTIIIFRSASQVKGLPLVIESL